MKKNTKRSLLLSVLALILCCALLAGTTLAWFTDTASSGVNKIQAGNLDVAVEYSRDGTNWTDIQGTESLFGSDLWEPGHTEYVYLKVSNAGSLGLKYKVLVTPVSENGGINVSGSNFKLSDYLVFGTTEPVVACPSYTRETARAAAGTTMGLNQNGMQKVGEIKASEPDEYLALVIYMPESVGNEANAKPGTTPPSINLGITVVATQLESEFDSFNNNYDGSAEYPVVVSSQTAFSETVAASTNSNIVLSAGTYTLPAAANKTVAISGTKDTVIDLTSATGQNLSGTDLTFENVTVKGTNTDYVGIQHSGDIVYNNVTFNESTTLYGESVTFNNCTFNLSTRYIWTYGAKEVTFNNCTFNTDGKAILIYAEQGVDSQTVNVNGCTFNARQSGHTFNGEHCAAVEIDAHLISGTYTVNFTGTNTVDTKFSGTYRIKNNSASKVTINGIN